MTELSELQSLIGYKFKNSKLLIRSLTHSSFNEKNVQNYEKLEFLGDRVLGLIISKKIYTNFTDDTEGELAKKLSFLVCKRTLKKVADELNLQEYINVSKEISGSSIESIKANSLEALIGAIFLDSNFETTEKVVNKLWKKQIKEIDLSCHDPKSNLQEWCLRMNNKLPEYSLIRKDGPDHKPEFTISVQFDKNLQAEGKGRNKQDAEINAARKLLEKIEN